MNNPQILIISDRYDFSCDYICIELEKRKQSYYRLNRDTFSMIEIEIDVSQNTMSIVDQEGEAYFFSERTLKSVFFRAPIFLRDNYKPELSAKAQLVRSQVTSFIRNLVIFEKVKWINHPQATFNAESKMFQLKKAYEVGFNVPSTIVSNSLHAISNDKDYIAKSLDVALFKMGNREAFVYSNRMSGLELRNSNISDVPIICQGYIYPKVDIRVTVIGEKAFSVRILKDGHGVQGDWRIEKDKIKYSPFALPDEVVSLCLNLQKKLGLVFGAIDLIECDGVYYFLEVNPTGEWAWLIKAANIPLHKAICDELQKF